MDMYSARSSQKAGGAGPAQGVREWGGEGGGGAGG